MTTEAILSGVSCGLAYLVVVLWLRMRRLSALCRRVAEHLGDEFTETIRNKKTHEALLYECERVGWDKKGKKR